MADKLGCLIMDLKSSILSSEEREMLAHPLVGGVILFSRNYDSPNQLKTLCESIRGSCRSPLLIMVDQEGGRVQRFIEGFTRLPHMAIFGDIYIDESESALNLSKDCGWLMATELLAMGVNLSLAPVLDLNKGLNTVIGERAFHAEPQVVISLAQAFIQGMQEAGMTATGKHFPGHGSVTADSHVALPIDQREFSLIEKDDLIPFAALIKAGISSIMAAHIVFSAVDNLPVGFSRIWLQTILRKQLGFTGTILSDDLNMAGANISIHYSDRVLAAREAGCDFVLLCNNRNGVIEVLDHVQAKTQQVSKEKWGILQGNFSHVKKPYTEDKRWLKTRECLQRIMQ